MLLRSPIALAGRCIPRAFFHTSRTHSALKRFKLADIGEGITEVEVIKWFVFLPDVRIPVLVRAVA